MTEVNRDAVRLLAAALRSGEYEQATGTLCRQYVGADNVVQKRGHCCLGVGAEVALKVGLPAELNFRRVDFITTGVGDHARNNAVYAWDEGDEGDEEVEEESHMPRPVAVWYGFDSQNPQLTVSRELMEEWATSSHAARNHHASQYLHDDPDQLVFHIHAVDLNDDFQLDFSEIADAFERTYLTD